MAVDENTIVNWLTRGLLGVVRMLQAFVVDGARLSDSARADIVDACTRLAGTLEKDGRRDETSVAKQFLMKLPHWMRPNVD